MPKISSNCSFPQLYQCPSKSLKPWVAGITLQNCQCYFWFFIFPKKGNFCLGTGIAFIPDDYLWVSLVINGFNNSLFKKGFWEMCSKMFNQDNLLMLKDGMQMNELEIKYLNLLAWGCLTVRSWLSWTFIEYPKNFVLGTRIQIIVGNFQQKCKVIESKCPQMY